MFGLVLIWDSCPDDKTFNLIFPSFKCILLNNMSFVCNVNSECAFTPGELKSQPRTQDLSLGSFFGIFLRDLSSGSFFGIFLRDLSSGSFFGIFLRDLSSGSFFFGSFFGIFLWDLSLGSFFGIFLHRSSGIFLLSQRTEGETLGTRLAEKFA